MTPTTAHDVSTYDATISFTPAFDATPDQLEEFTLEVERIVNDEAYGASFGASAMCTFDPPQVDLDLSIDAVSISVVNRRMAEIMEVVEKALPVRAGEHQRVAAAS